MNLDLSQFLGVFYEEGRVLVSDLRAQLAVLATPDAGPNAYSDCIRAAHSIKGAAASFGLDSVVKHSRCVEHALLMLRDCERHFDARTRALLCAAVDDLEDMLIRLERGLAVDADTTRRFSDAFAQTSTNDDVAPEPIQAASLDDQRQARRIWRIELSAGAFDLGGSPQPEALFMALAALGQLEVREAQLEHLDLTGELTGSCQIGWVLALTTTAGLAAVQEMTDWVADPDAVKLFAEPVPAQHVCTLNGPLRHGTLGLARDELLASMHCAKDVTIKLGGVDAVDSAGLHMLVAAAKDAPARGVCLHWEQVPTCATALADRLGLRQALGW